MRTRKIVEQAMSIVLERGLDRSCESCANWVRRKGEYDCKAFGSCNWKRRESWELSAKILSDVLSEATRRAEKPRTYNVLFGESCLYVVSASNRKKAAYQAYLLHKQRYPSMPLTEFTKYALIQRSEMDE